MEVEVVANVNPTESVEKVESAIRNVVGDIDLKRMSSGEMTVLGGHLSGLGSLGRLKELLRRRRIREAARAFLIRRAEEDILVFSLNRQAAYAGVISFYHPQEAPLGPIQITIRGDVEQVINYLCKREG